MKKDLSYIKTHEDANWGSHFLEISKAGDVENVFVCHVQIKDLIKIATELSTRIMNQNWIMELDPGARRTYQRTVADTAATLVDIFTNKLHADGKVSTEFGEIMVSMGSARAMELIFGHFAIPIAELWKPKIKGNEGFDFHTVCKDKFVHFGEAKFSGLPSVNPYGGNSGDSNGAGGQADSFIEQEKHYRDRPYLRDLLEKNVIENLDKELFGVVLAFSMNAKDPLSVFKSAIDKALSYQHLKKAKNIYIVGVTYAA